MENTIGWLLIAALCIAPVLIVRWVIRRNRASEQEHRDRIDRIHAEVQAAQNRENERRRQQALRPSLTTVPVMAGGGGGRSTTRSYASTATALPQTTATATVPDTTLQDLAMLYMMNSMTQDHNRTIDVTPAAPQIESSRDEDRVVRDTFSSSDSSSSWSSSDSSSSSDSGPSSDW